MVFWTRLPVQSPFIDTMLHIHLSFLWQHVRLLDRRSNYFEFYREY